MSAAASPVFSEAITDCKRFGRCYSWVVILLVLLGDNQDAYVSMTVAVGI